MADTHRTERNRLLAEVDAQFDRFEEYELGKLLESICRRLGWVRLVTISVDDVRGEATHLPKTIKDTEIFDMCDKHLWTLGRGDHHRAPLNELLELLRAEKKAN